MPSKLPSFLLTVLLCLAAAVLPAHAGEVTDADPSAFPLPVLAPVLVPEDVTASLAVTSYGIAPEGDAFEVRFAQPFELPDAFLYRVALHVGDPEGAQQRVSFVVEEGESRGLIEEGEEEDWDEVGTINAEFATDGRIVLELPSDLVEDLTTDDEALAWVEAELVRESNGGNEQFVTPLVPAVGLLAPERHTLTPAGRGWGSTDQPPEPSVGTGTPPTLRVEGDQLIVEYAEPLPTEVGGGAVESVKDVIRIAPDFREQGAAPYLLVIDHGNDSVSLLDGSTGLLPAEVPNDGSWLVEGLPTRGVREGDVVRASLSGILSVFGLTSEDPAADNHVALGLARSVHVADETDPAGEGIDYGSDGVLATSEWLVGDGAATAPGSTSPAVEPDDEETSTRSKLFAPVVTVSIIALLATASYLLARWMDHRRKMRATGPMVPTRPTPEPTEEEREELEEFTREIFGGR